VQALTRVFVRRPTLAMVFCTLVVIAGVLSFRTLVQQQFPDIDFPTVQIRVSYSGAPPSEIRDAIVRPIEDAVAGAPDLDHINTTIQQGQATISATFTLSSNQTTDLVEIQRRLQSVRGALPTDLPAPSIGTFDPAQATVATLTVTSSSLNAATISSTVNDQIVPEMEQIDGVSNVNAAGVVTPAIEVNVDPYKVSAANLTLGDIVTAISSNNVRAPGGLIYGPDRETNVDVRGDLSSVESVADLPLTASSGTGAASLAGPSGGSAARGPSSSSSGGGSAASASTSQAANLASSVALQTPATATVSTSGLNPFSVSRRVLTIGDVATIVDSFEPKRSFSYVNGYPAITLSIQKGTGASEVDASNNVLAALPRLAHEYPALTFKVLNVQATYTQQQLNSVYYSLSEGVFFTGLVMLFFLRSWRNAIVVMIAIPTSFGVTLILMKLAGFTIDTISLLAMTLLIGILVDDSIVVLENTERHFDDGEAPLTAAILGRAEMGAAAVVITLVDVVVFLPISFLPGTVGRFLAEFGLVVVGATLTSLFVSFTVTPALAGNWSLRSKWKPPGIIDAFSRGFERVRRFYVERVLTFALDHRWIVVIGCTLAVAGALSLIPLHLIGFEFIPSIDRGEIFAQVNFPVGTPLTTADAAIQKLSREFVGNPDVQSITSTSGTYQAGFGGSIALGNAGQIHIFLNTKHRRSTDAWTALLNKKWQAEYPKAIVTAVQSTGMGGGNSQPIDYIVTSSDDNPEPWVARIAAVLQKVPGAINVNTSQTNAVPQVDVNFDREKARALNIDIATAANAVRASFGGSLAAQFTTAFGVKYVQVIYPPKDQTDLSEIDDIPIRNRAGSLLYVGDLATIANAPVAPLLTRVNRSTVLHVGANAAKGTAISQIQDTFKTRLAALNLPSSVSVRPNAGGQQQNLGDTVNGLGSALLLAFALVYLLMVALYDSYRLPFIIMFAVPVASVGALGALAITGLTLNLFSLIGVVMLVGLVSKNGILLVDFANHRIRAGIDRVSAIRESARERFRPIVMTTISMIAGMTPIALALDPGSGVRQALGVVVIGGLTSSLVLTLILVPVVFVWFAPKFDHPIQNLTEQERALVPHETAPQGVQS
jgi:hydrophobic/amphiphilic exporter-1 (mainly G- bacteria), HAE1 family